VLVIAIGLYDDRNSGSSGITGRSPESTGEAGKQPGVVAKDRQDATQGESQGQQASTQSILEIPPMPLPEPAPKWPFLAGKISGTPFTPECQDLAAQSFPAPIGAVYYCYYFGSAPPDPHDLRTCDELMAYVSAPGCMHCGQALSEEQNALYNECHDQGHSLGPPSNDFERWYFKGVEERDKFCTAEPFQSLAEIGNCMYSGKRDVTRIR